MTVQARSRTEHQLVAGAGGQAALLAVLSTTVGLGAVGWATGLAYSAVLSVLLAVAARRASAGTLGPAGLVTLARAVLVGGVTAVVADELAGGAPAVRTLVLLVAVALVLDAVDGIIARRTGTVSALGARFDMEADAFLLLVLSVHVADLVGAWAVAIGAMRYAFVAAGRVLPWLRAPLPPRFSAKTVAALQGVVLVLATTEVLPYRFAMLLVATALVLLTWSFARDSAWLWRHAHTGGPPTPAGSTPADLPGAARPPTG